MYCEITIVYILIYVNMFIICCTDVCIDVLLNVYYVLFAYVIICSASYLSLFLF